MVHSVIQLAGLGSDRHRNHRSIHTPHLAQTTAGRQEDDGRPVRPDHRPHDGLPAARVTARQPESTKRP